MNPGYSESDGLAKDVTQEGDTFRLSIPEKKIVCVAYPGKVVNVERALQTLGGEEKISQKILGSTQRLPLHFRPEDNFCKPLYGNKYSTTNLLMKVTRRKEEGDGSQTHTSLPEQHSDNSSNEYSCEIMGVVDRTYKFQGMSDFQYLPVERREDGTYKDISQDLLPSETESSSFVKKDMPLLILPGSFSRMDMPSTYLYQKEKIGLDPTLDDKLIGKRRKKRTSGAYLLTYDNPEVPAKAHEAAVLKMQRLRLHDEVEILKKLFEERPIWTRTSLLARSKMTYNILRDSLPAIACYFVSGPWRTTWCLLGYDPRKEKSSRMYQVVEFRIRKQLLSKTKSFIRRRSMYSLFSVPALHPRLEKKGPSLLTNSEEEEEIPSRTSTIPTEAHYILREGLIPPHYNMCYQFCDLHSDELRNIIAEAEVSETCDPKSGWFSSDLCNQLRDKMTEIVERTASKILKEDSKQPMEHQMEVDEEEEEYDDADDKEDLSDGEDEEEGEDEEGDVDSENEPEMELLSYLEPMDS